MRALTADSCGVLLALLAGCASPAAAPDPAPPRPDELACRQWVDARFAGRIVAPSRGVSALCRGDGGLVPCRNTALAAGPTGAGRPPPSAHDEDAERLVAQCLAGQEGPGR